ncbi:3456_t:CDS:1, partial [Paraglomus brasilianum]
IGIQKFISQEQVDRNGEIYWRYYSPEVKKEVEKSEVSKEASTPTKSEPDPITKFNQRQTQAQDYAKSNISEPTVNEQSN